MPAPRAQAPAAEEAPAGPSGSVGDESATEFAQLPRLPFARHEDLSKRVAASSVRPGSIIHAVGPLNHRQGTGGTVVVGANGRGLAASAPGKTTVPLVGVDLFAGAGGMSLGARQAGIEVLLAVEHDPNAVATYAANHPGTRVERTDIRKFSARASVGFLEGKKTILFGGPPCSGFSYSNQRTRSLENPSNWLFLEFLRIAGELEPEWVLLENVRGMVTTKEGVFLTEILEGLQELGYLTSWAVLNAADFGVPQHRHRLFVLGSREGYKNVLPEKAGVSPPVVEDALHDLPILRNGAGINSRPYRSAPESEYARLMRGSLETCKNHLVTNSGPVIIERYRHVPPGGNWQNIPKELLSGYANVSNCHTGIYHRLRPDLPSKVIGNFRKNMLIHPHQDRGISVREAARIQSFPDDYEFVGSIGFQQQQVSNAVPPLLAKAVFDCISRQNEAWANDA